MSVRGRALVALVVAAASLLVGAAPTGGQEAPAAGVVAIEDSFGVGGFISRDCDGDDVTYPGVAAVVLGRTPVDGDDPFPAVVVGVGYAGPAAEELLDRPSVVSFEAGSDIAFLDLALLVPGTGSLTVTLEPGPGYALDEPSSVTIDLAGAQLASDCTARITTSGGEARQTITVGQVPGGFFLIEDEGVPDGSCVEVAFADGTGAAAYCVREGDIFDEFLRTQVQGTLPSGLAYQGDAWSGAATTPGVYPLEVSLCEALSRRDPGGGPGPPEAQRSRADPGDRGIGRALRRAVARAGEDDLLCIGTLDVEITVVAVAAPPPPPPTATPAVPVSSAARFTG